MRLPPFSPRAARFSRSPEKARSSCMRPVERTDRVGGGLQQHLAALFREIGLSFRRWTHIAHLARAENELLAAALENKLCLVLREDMRGAIVLLRQFLLPLRPLGSHRNTFGSEGAAPRIWR